MSNAVQHKVIRNRFRESRAVQFDEDAHTRRDRLGYFLSNDTHQPLAYIDTAVIEIIRLAMWVSGDGVQKFIIVTSFSVQYIFDIQPRMQWDNLKMPWAKRGKACYGCPLPERSKMVD